MLAERLARLLGSVLMLAALLGSVLSGDLDAGAATDIRTTGFEWGASIGVAVVDGSAAVVAPSGSAVITGGIL